MRRLLMAFVIVASSGAALLAQQTAPVGTYVGPDIRLAAPLSQSPTGPLPDRVNDRLKAEVDNLSSQDFRPTLANTIREVARDAPASLTIGLTQGIEYAFIATCIDCKKVELILLDGAQTELARSPEDADTVILNGAAPATADFQVSVSVQGCAAARCYAGLAVMRKITTALPAMPQRSVAVAPPPDPPLGNRDAIELAKSVQTGLKRVGCYLGNIDGNWSAKSSAALMRFNRSTKLSLKTDVPETDAIAALALYKLRVCPSPCSDDEIEKDGVCAAKPIPRVEPRKAAVEQKTAAVAHPSPTSGGPRCANHETSCSSARNFCIRNCRERHQSPRCSLDCQSAFQLCKTSGSWSTTFCKREGLARD